MTVKCLYCFKQEKYAYLTLQHSSSDISKILKESSFPFQIFICQTIRRKIIPIITRWSRKSHECQQNHIWTNRVVDKLDNNCFRWSLLLLFWWSYIWKNCLPANNVEMCGAASTSSILIQFTIIMMITTAIFISRCKGKRRRHERSVLWVCLI